MSQPPSDAEQLRRAIQWLKTHQETLLADRETLLGLLADADKEIERLAGEIARAEARLDGLATAGKD